MIELTREKETPGTIRFQEQDPDEDPKVGTLYVKNLRAGASLILAALAANGTTTIRGAHHVHRGYEKIDRKFLELGARIERLAEGT